VAKRLKPSRPCGAEEPARVGLHEAHRLVHPVERRLRRVPGLLGTAREQPLELDEAMRYVKAEAGRLFGAARPRGL
jgi:hypothetical protein